MTTVANASREAGRGIVFVTAYCYIFSITASPHCYYYYYYYYSCCNYYYYYHHHDYYYYYYCYCYCYYYYYYIVLGNEERCLGARFR